jgi:hypothetical protein
MTSRFTNIVDVGPHILSVMLMSFILRSCTMDCLKVLFCHLCRCYE